MNAKQLKEFFEHPEKIDDSALVTLKQAVQDFPFAAPLQVLYMKALQNQDNYQLPAQVKRSAIAVSDRALLRDFYEATSHAVKPVAIEFDLDAYKAQKAKKSSASKKKLKVTHVEEAPKLGSAPSNPNPVVPKRDADNLDHLPESVRNAILRSRALTKGGLVPRQSTTPKPAEIGLDAKLEPKVPQTETKVSLTQRHIESEKSAVTENEDLRVMPFSEKASFLEWLNADHKVEVRTIDSSQEFARVEVVEQAEEGEAQGNEIRKIIRELPKLEVEAKHQKINVFTLEANEEGKFVTETLAEIYFGQRLFDKAIKAYEILSLKYPEKSGFFADRIRAIKKEKNS